MSTDNLRRDRAASPAPDGVHAAICPVCMTCGTGDPDVVGDLVAIHNESLHDGERVACRVAPNPDHIRVFLDGVERDYGSEARAEIESKMGDVEPWGALDG